MLRQNEKNDRDLEGNVALNNRYPEYTRNSSDAFQSACYENEDYRFMYANNYTSSMEIVEPSTPLVRTCFLGFVQSKESKNVGPFILNITPNEERKAIQIFDLQFDFIDEDKFADHNTSQTRTIIAVQKKLENILNGTKIAHTKESRNTSENLKELFYSKEMKFKVTPLPFDHFYINSGDNKRVASVDSGSQTIDVREKEYKKDGDMITVLREQIQILKDQNQLLRQHQEIAMRQNSGRPTREYVIRKQSQSTTKSTRNNSATSTDMVIESQSIISGKRKDSKENLRSVTLLTNENSSLQEMLQEYMLENEDLRHRNNSLEEVRANHHSEMDMISRKNVELSLQVDELSKKVRDESSRSHLSGGLNSIRKDANQLKNESGGYPILYENTEMKNDKTSYLRQYDSLKNKSQTESTKRATSIPTKISVADANLAKSIEGVSKTQSDRKLANDSLLEELNRIDVTIKEHIKTNQINDTLRSMGRRQSPRRN